MGTFVKILVIVIVCIVVLVAVVAGLGIYWWSHHGQQLVQASKTAAMEGKTFGTTSDQAGCLTEALARQERSKDFTDAVANDVFLRTCLGASRPTPGFCAGVPRQTDFLASVRWQMEKCPGLANATTACRQLYTQVQHFCDESKPRPGGTEHKPGAGV